MSAIYQKKCHRIVTFDNIAHFSKNFNTVIDNREYQLRILPQKPENKLIAFVAVLNYNNIRQPASQPGLYLPDLYLNYI